MLLGQGDNCKSIFNERRGATGVSSDRRLDLVSILL